MCYQNFINPELRSIHPNAYVTIPNAGAGCTRAYRIGKVYDDFDSEYGEDQTVDWNTVAQEDIKLQFDMKKFYFSDAAVGEIFPTGRYVMRFNTKDRRWYTKDRVEDPLFPGLYLNNPKFRYHKV